MQGKYVAFKSITLDKYPQRMPLIGKKGAPCTVYHIATTRTGVLGSRLSDDNVF